MPTLFHSIFFVIIFNNSQDFPVVALAKQLHRASSFSFEIA